MPALQLEINSTSFDDLLAEVRGSGLLPVESITSALSEADRALVVEAWQEGMTSAAGRQAAAQLSVFKERGWACKWFSEWRPATSPGVFLSHAIESALDVVEDHYPRILARGLSHAEDMGILQSQGRGKSEGVAVKRDAYGQNILISVFTVVGPSNFDPAGGTVEFEPGARSHVFHLVYRDQLPTLDRLYGDIAAYPVVTAPANREEGRGVAWLSEGWTGPHASRPHRHRSWDTLPGPPADARSHAWG